MQANQTPSRHREPAFTVAPPLALSGNLHSPTVRTETASHGNGSESIQRIGFLGTPIISGALAMSDSLRKALTGFPEGSTARRIQDNPIIGVDMLEVLKEVSQLFPAHATSIGARIHAAIVLAEPNYLTPTVPFVSSEAALIGSLLDSEALDQGEPN
jgi:hypothetical protein